MVQDPEARGILDLHSKRFSKQKSTLLHVKEQQFAR